MFKKLGVCILVLAICFVLSTNSYGQCRRSSRHVVINNTPHEIVTTEDYVNPAYVPILVPATIFQYLPATQAQPAIDDVALEKRIQERVDAILRERLSKQQGDGPPMLLAVNDIPSREGTDSRTLDQKTAEALANYSCVNCHTSGIKIRGDVQLFKKQGDNLLFSPTVSRETIFKAIKGPSPKMPPSAKGDSKHPTAVKAEDVALIEKWSKLK